MTSQQSQQTDVIIIGSGGAGVTASIEAREAGAEVIVLEQEASLGGAAAISGGGCCLVGTELQRSQGIEDSADLAFDNWIRFGQGAADEVWVRFYVENSDRELFQWGQDRGIQWDRLNQQEGNTVPRWHHPQGGGGGLWRALYQSAQERGVDQWLTATAAREFIMDRDRVFGVRTENIESGQIQDFYAKGVVVASGGFASNLDMVLEHRPDLRQHRIMEGSHVGATGCWSGWRPHLPTWTKSGSTPSLFPTTGTPTNAGAW